MLVAVVNEKGNIGIAIALVLIGVLSGVALSSVAFRDSYSFRNQLDAVQQFHFLRSEVGRGRFMASHFESMESPPMQSTLPIRQMSVSFGKHSTVYSAKTKLDVYEALYDTGYFIRSLITATRGTVETTAQDNVSKVKRYSENRIRSLQTLAIFHYFSDIDRERDDVPGNIRFFAGDIIHGRVHSNTDIWILANSWPTFYGLVSTAGEIKVHPGGGSNYPKDQIFRGGLIENYRRIAFEPSASIVRRSGSWPFGRDERNDRICYVTVEGSSYSVMYGDIVIEDPVPAWIEGYNQFTIYNSYPPYGVVGDSIGVNRMPKKDTLWMRMPGGSVHNTSVFVPMELWISGTFGGRQTWASSHNIYLKDDMLYQSTVRGLPPDGGPDGLYPVNRSDYLGIISEKSVIIQYGHRSPEDSVRYRPNTNDIYMYGAYCAVGQGPNAWDDGIFTFQYQFPKGSTPPQYWIGERFRYIDLHLFHYPTTAMNRWPAGMDYPYYNPLWPEPGPLYNRGFPASFPFPIPPQTPNPHGARIVVHLRGAIYLFGSVAQRRRGYVRRSGNADFDTGEWDVENLLSPTTPPTYGAPPPSLISPTGYDKRYTFDTRFENIGPPHFPLVKFEGFDSDDLMDLGHLTVSWAFKRPPSNF